MGERADESMQEQRKAVKRGGILAAAGAVVAGMVAKQVAEEAPVRANQDVWTLPYFGTATNAGAAFMVTNTHDTAIFATGGDGYGVSASSTSASGIIGVTNAPAGSGNWGVAGYASGSGTFGVVGEGVSGTGVGVHGQSDGAGGTGVKGISASGFPIIGNVTGASNTAAGVLGAGTVGPGVQGQSTGGHGLVGTTDATDGHAGLIGNATHAGGIGLMGIAPDYGTMSVGLAGDFFGNVKINGGTLSAPVMQAVVKHQGDNTYRTLYSVASPESWCEDVGKGTLAGDRAEINLDPDFAALIHTDDYHVFLTPHTPQHLHVSEQSASGFTVVATPSGVAQTGGPKRAEGSGTFSWKVQAKRKDIVGERLAKVAASPPSKVPTAFTIPETPEVKAPGKKP